MIRIVGGLESAAAAGAELIASAELIVSSEYERVPRIVAIRFFMISPLFPRVPDCAKDLP
jgi:hypothetical protein